VENGRALRTFLVAAGEAAEADHVSGKDSGELS
jgi:hypothetical protein